MKNAVVSLLAHCATKCINTTVIFSSNGTVTTISSTNTPRHVLTLNLINQVIKQYLFHHNYFKSEFIVE